MAVGDTAPLGIGCEQICERVGITVVQSLCRRTQLIDHAVLDYGSGATVSSMADPLVELLYFDGCPNYIAARETVVAVAAEIEVSPNLRLIEVKTPEAADELRFLGSPTIRVDGKDVEPGADERTQFQFACRVYRTPAGFSGTPDPEWVRQALLSA
jgi:hypothetical protein